MKKKLLIVPLAVVIALVAASWPMSDSCNEALVTPPPKGSPVTGYRWEEHHIIAIRWGSPPPEAGHTDPEATVVYQAEAVEKMPPKDVDAKWAGKMEAPNREAPKKVRKKQKEKMKKLIMMAKREGIKKGFKTPPYKREKGEKVRHPFSDGEQFRQRDKIKATGVTEKEVRATVIRLKGEVPSYVKLREADSPEEFRKPIKKPFDPSYDTDIEAEGYKLHYEGGMLYRDPRGKPYYIFTVTYPDGTERRVWARDSPAVLRDPSDGHRNLLVDFNPEEGTVEFAPAKKKPPSRISALDRLSLFLDHLIHQELW